jgi:hypothetical protein
LQSARIVQRALLANAAKVWTAPPFGKGRQTLGSGNESRAAGLCRGGPYGVRRHVHLTTGYGAGRIAGTGEIRAFRGSLVRPDVRPELGGVHRATAVPDASCESGRYGTGHPLEETANSGNIHRLRKPYPSNVG